MSDKTTIRSYRRVFSVDRRVYKVDRWILPVPGGVPIRGLAYFGGALLVVLVLGLVPLIGDLLDLIGPILRYVFLPAAIGIASMQATPDGRPAPRFAWSWVAFQWRVRGVPPEGARTGWAARLRVRWDADSPTLRKARVCGPATVTSRLPIELNDRWDGWWAEGGRGAPCTIAVRDDQTLKVRP